MKKKRVYVYIVIMGALIFSICGCKRGQPVMLESDYDTNEWIRGFSNICRNENGYYIISTDFLYVVDADKNVTPLCNKADCNHMNEDCNAYIKNALTQTVWYDGNNIYVVAGVKAAKYALYKINPDGSGNEKVCDLFQASGTSGILVTSYFYKNYMYYVSALQTAAEARAGRMNPKLYRVELKNSAKPELIYEADTEDVFETSIGRCIFDGDYMYVALIKSTETGIDNSSELYRYSLTENRLELVIDHFVSNYFVKGDVVYYTSADGIHTYSINEKKDEIFYEDPRFCSTMLFDGEYIYLDDSWYQSTLDDSGEQGDTIFVLDMSGNIIQEISVPEHGMELFGDGNEIIVREIKSINEENRSYNAEVFHFWDKSQIKNGTSEWIELEIEETNVVE